MIFKSGKKSKVFPAIIFFRTCECGSVGWQSLLLIISRETDIFRRLLPYSQPNIFLYPTIFSHVPLLLGHALLVFLWHLMCYPTSHSSSCSYFVKISVIAVFPPHRLSSYCTLPCSEWYALAWNAFMWLCHSYGSVYVMHIPCTYPDFLFRPFYFNMCFTSFSFYSRYASISCFASFIINYTFISKELWKIISYIWSYRIRYVLKTDIVYFLLN